MPRASQPLRSEAVSGGPPRGFRPQTVSRPADSAAHSSESRYRTASSTAAATRPVASIPALLRSQVSAQNRLMGLPGSSGGTCISAATRTNPAPRGSRGYDGTRETPVPMVSRSPCHIARITTVYGVPGARSLVRSTASPSTGTPPGATSPAGAVIRRSPSGRCISTKRAWTSRNRPGTKSGAVMSALQHVEPRHGPLGEETDVAVHGEHARHPGLVQQPAGDRTRSGAHVEAAASRAGPERPQPRQGDVVVGEGAAVDALVLVRLSGAEDVLAVPAAPSRSGGHVAARVTPGVPSPARSGARPAEDFGGGSSDCSMAGSRSRGGRCRAARRGAAAPPILHRGPPGRPRRAAPGPIGPPEIPYGLSPRERAGPGGPRRRRCRRGGHGGAVGR